MKLLFVAYNIVLDEDLMLLLRRLSVKFYTKFPRATGVGANSGARLDNHVWPGANCAMMIVTDDAKADEIMDAIQVMRDSAKNEGLYAFLTNVEKTTV